MPKNPNPQGKGLAPLMAMLDESRGASQLAAPKTLREISVELFTSLFVLESDFRFRPVPGNGYWLYRKQGRFRLSPIGPHEWDPRVYGRYVGHCELQQDLTWTLELCPEAAQDQPLMALIEERRRVFAKQLQQAPTLAQALPGYQDAMPFNQRMFAFGLAHSLRTSMELSGIAALNYEEAMGLLAGPES
ncbi:MAG: DUF2452 domain-containing protein [Halomonadaceae bacterium]|nr:MAG: DUF2452 domain-containing protein [Halomonadaceae bacterium]